MDSKSKSSRDCRSKNHKCKYKKHCHHHSEQNLKKLTVTEKTNLNGCLHVCGDAKFNDDVHIQKKLYVNGDEIKSCQCSCNDSNVQTLTKLTVATTMENTDNDTCLVVQDKTFLCNNVTVGNDATVHCLDVVGKIQGKKLSITGVNDSDVQLNLDSNGLYLGNIGDELGNNVSGYLYVDANGFLKISSN